jgi:hypothetical protein
MNIDEIDHTGEVIRTLCFYPRGRLSAGDVMLAQKVALELFEQEALAIAHSLPRSAHFHRIT